MLTERGLDSDIRPVLSDGTPVDDLIDLERREVGMRVLSDPVLYRFEMDMLFAKVWIVVAHETEIPDPGGARSSRCAAVGIAGRPTSSPPSVTT